MKKYLAYIICIVLILTGYFYSRQIQYQKSDNPEQIAKGVVLSTKEVGNVESSEESGNLFAGKKWAVRVKITSGPFQGRVVDTEHFEGENPAYDYSVYPGDKVVLSLETEDHVLKNVYISDISRDRYIMYLFLLFISCIILIGSWQGFKTIISLGVTAWAVIQILLPAILAGRDPVFVTIMVCTGITVITHLLVTGLTRKSLSAIIGTMAGIIIAGILARSVIILGRINGLTSEESRMFFFAYAEGKLDITGLLFAGIVIGSLGAVMDVAMSIASSITEIYQANPDLSFSRLFKSGINIGRDVMGTMSNTLILAYTGSALPLMLLITANNIPFLKYINLEMIATEIIRALSGSIGLFLAVPFTAAISAWLCKWEKGD